VNFLEWHPFTLASGPKEKMNEVDIKSLGNFTKKLVEMANEKGGSLWIRADGPYGKWPMNYARYPNVMLVCGGVGVTPCIALLRHIFHVNRENGTLDGIAKNVYFVWSCKSEQEYSWFETEMNEILSKSGTNGFPTLHNFVHITSNKGDGNLPAHLKPGRPDLKSVFNQVSSAMNAKGMARTFVVTCGPAQMVSDTWDLCTKNGMNDKRFDFHHETFEF
jgi:predicted ferric reductase